MTADLRHSLRLAIDRAVRARIDWDADLRCAGCGIEQIDPDSGTYRYVPGCPTCTDRAGKRRLRHAEREQQGSASFAGTTPGEAGYSRPTQLTFEVAV